MVRPKPRTHRLSRIRCSAGQGTAGTSARGPTHHARTETEPPYLLVRASRLPLVTLCGLLAHLASASKPLSAVLESAGLKHVRGFSLRFRLHTALSDFTAFNSLKRYARATSARATTISLSSTCRRMETRSQPSCSAIPTSAAALGSSRNSTVSWSPVRPANRPSNRSMSSSTAISRRRRGRRRQRCYASAAPRLAERRRTEFPGSDGSAGYA